MSTRSVRALWCSRRALGVPCAVSFVSGVAAPSLHRGRPRSTPTCSRSVDDTGLVAGEVVELESALAARVRVLTCHSAHFTLLCVVCHCLSTRSVRALWCSRRALSVPCAVSFVSGVAAPSPHRGRPRSTPSLRATRCDHRHWPPPVRLALSSRALSLSLLAKGPTGRSRRPVSDACVRPSLADALNAPRSASKQTRTDGLVPTLRTCFRNGWAGSHLTSPASDSDGLVPTVRDLEGSSHPWLLFSGAKPPLSQKGLVT